ncbi:MAG: sugar ABC transporter permease [Gemmiger sp.]|nr:sugar ABC transporter permease [Gemmiger sp.]
MRIKKTLSPLQRREEVTGYLFLLPSFIGFLVFILIPVAWGLLLAFTDYDGFNPPQFVGVKNFVALFQDDYFYLSLKNNIYYMVVSVAGIMIIGLLLAVFLDKGIRGSGIFRTVLFFPQLTSSIAFGMIMAILFTSRGPINNFLRELGMLNPPRWLTDTQWVMTTITLTSIIKNTGYYMILFLAGLQAVPKDLYEAAALDGAGSWKKFTKITWPMITPTFFLCMVLCIINSFKVFDLVSQMTNGGPANASNVLVYRIYTEAFKFGKFGYASAYGIVLFAIVLLITLVQFRGQKKWVNY